MDLEISTEEVLPLSELRNWITKYNPDLCQALPFVQNGNGTANGQQYAAFVDYLCKRNLVRVLLFVIEIILCTSCISLPQRHGTIAVSTP